MKSINILLDCKSAYTGSIPVHASIKINDLDDHILLKNIIHKSYTVREQFPHRLFSALQYYKCNQEDNKVSERNVSTGVQAVPIHKRLVLDKRENSDNWYARLSLPDGSNIRRSTKTADIEVAKEIARKINYETEARIENKLPASTRKFRQAAEHTIKRMNEDLDAGIGKSACKDYISALRVWFLPYFANIDINKINFKALTEFNTWRDQKHGKRFSQSGINNHNAVSLPL